MPGSVSSATSSSVQHIVSRCTEPSASKIGISPFNDSVQNGTNEPITMFRQKPHITANAMNLAYHEANKNLGPDFLDAKLSATGSDIRSLVGIISNELIKSGNKNDIATYKVITEHLIDSKGKEDKEKTKEATIARLVSQYSTTACTNIKNQYIVHCENAWHQYHQEKGIDVSSEKFAIFKAELESCKATVDHVIDNLAKPDQPWETMAQNLRFFINGCAAISKTLDYVNNKPSTPAADAPALNGPAADGPAPLNVGPDGGTDNQRLFIPTGPGQGGITLNITSQGGSVGNITNSVGNAAAGPADSNSAIAKHVLDSGLSNVEKMDLIKYLADANCARNPGGFLNNLQSVEAFKPEQTVVTPHMGVATREMATQTDAIQTEATTILTNDGTESNVQQMEIKGQEVDIQTDIPDMPVIATQTENVESNTTTEVTEVDGEPELNAQQMSGVEHEMATDTDTPDTEIIASRAESADDKDTIALTNSGPEDAQLTEGANQEEAAGSGNDMQVVASQPDGVDTGTIDVTQAGSETTVQEHVTNQSINKTEIQSVFEQRESRVTASLTEVLTEVSDRGEKSSTGALETPTSAVDNPDGRTLRVNRSLSDSTSAPVYTTARTFDPLNRRNSTPTHFAPRDTGHEVNASTGKTVTLADKFKALKTRDASAFDHLDKNGTARSQNIASKPGAEQGVETTVADPFIVPGLESELNHEPKLNPDSKLNDGAKRDLPDGSDRSLVGRVSVNKQTATPAGDSLDGGATRNSSAQGNRKSNVSNFQPARFTPKAASETRDKTPDNRVYTTVRTVDFWQREAQPVNFVPTSSKSDVEELDAKFDALKRRDIKILTEPKEQDVETKKELEPFQQKLAEIKSKSNRQVNNHE